MSKWGSSAWLKIVDGFIMYEQPTPTQTWYWNCCICWQVVNVKWCRSYVWTYGYPMFWELYLVLSFSKFQVSIERSKAWNCRTYICLYKVLSISLQAIFHFLQFQRVRTVSRIVVIKEFELLQVICLAKPDLSYVIHKNHYMTACEWKTGVRKSLQLPQFAMICII